MSNIKRFEFKYPLLSSKAKLVEKELKKYGMKVDPYASSEDGSYIVNSIYFDSWNFDNYLDKMGGLLSRRKIRLRTYEDKINSETKKIWLEIKEKHNMMINKERVVLSYGDCHNLLASFSSISKNHFLHKDQVFKKAITCMLMDGLSAKIAVKYKRKPLVLDGLGYFRITFDSHIETCKIDGLTYNDRMLSVAKDVVVMELKYDKFIPKWFLNVVRKFDLQRDAFSKYALSVDRVNSYKPLHH